MAQDNGSAPKSRVIDWAALVRKAWGPAFNEPDNAYEFSNSREFKSTDGARGGPYEGSGS